MMQVSITTIERKDNKLKQGLSIEVIERKQRVDKFLLEKVGDFYLDNYIESCIKSMSNRLQ